MTEEENFVVAEPYQPTKEERQAIAKLEAKGIIPADWDSGKKYIKSFKKNVRDDMYEKQNKKCAYCRIHVPLACVPMHREHIVYKDKHPQWMFLPENLCVACPTCNEFKGTDEVLENPKALNYPKDSSGFKIIHPMYDKYSDHIELVEDILYKGKTPKGVFTINTCHLYRAELAEERVDMKMLAENKGNIIAELIGLTKLPDLYVDEKDKLIKYVGKIVNQYKQAQKKVVPAP